MAVSGGKKKRVVPRDPRDLLAVAGADLGDHDKRHLAKHEAWDHNHKIGEGKSCQEHVGRRFGTWLVTAIYKPCSWLFGRGRLPQLGDLAMVINYVS